jgi:hypothetical protein
MLFFGIFNVCIRIFNGDNLHEEESSLTFKKEFLEAMKRERRMMNQWSDRNALPVPKRRKNTL